MKDKLKGALLIITSMLIFGFIGIVVRTLKVPSLIVALYNFLFSGAMLFIFFLIKDKSKIIIKNYKKYLCPIILLGVFNGIGYFLYLQAFVFTTISNAVLTHYSAPIFVALLAPLLLKERLQKITILALIISTIGLVFISYKDISFNSKDFVGIIYGVASGIMYALIIIYIKFLSKNISIYTIVIYNYFVAVIVLAPFAIKSDFVVSLELLFTLILFALVFGVFAGLLHSFGIKKVKSQDAGILAYVEPLAATIYAIIFFSEFPSLNTIIGGTFILIGGYLVIRKGL